MKVCRKCKEEKPLTEFYANKSSSDGRILYCRSCSKALKKVWYAENQEKVKAASAAYRAANQEKVKAASTAYRAANQEKLRANKDANKERLKALKKVWYAENQEKVKASGTAYRAANQEKIKSAGVAYRKSLSDAYISQKLHLPVAVVPKELIKLKREQIKMYRATKQLTKTIKEIQDAA